MTGAVKKKEREAGHKELKRLRVTGNRHLGDEVGQLLASKCVLDLNYSHVQRYLTETEIIF